MSRPTSARAEWSITQWAEAIASLPEEDRWYFVQMERAVAGPGISRSAIKRLTRAMGGQGNALAQAWLELRPDLGDRCLDLEVAS